MLAKSLEIYREREKNRFEDTVDMKEKKLDHGRSQVNQVEQFLCQPLGQEKGDP